MQEGNRNPWPCFSLDVLSEATAGFPCGFGSSKKLLGWVALNYPDSTDFLSFAVNVPVVSQEDIRGLVQRPGIAEEVEKGTPSWRTLPAG